MVATLQPLEGLLARIEISGLQKGRLPMPATATSTATTTTTAMTTTATTTTSTTTATTTSAKWTKLPKTATRMVW